MFPIFCHKFGSLSHIVRAFLLSGSPFFTGFGQSILKNRESSLYILLRTIKNYMINLLKTEKNLYTHHLGCMLYLFYILRYYIPGFDKNSRSRIQRINSLFNT